MTKKYATKGGKELTTIPMQGGSEYLPVEDRLSWFREVHPDWVILTEQVAVDLHLEGGTIVIKATISDADGRVVATGHKQEKRSSFDDYVEKAETGAIGRALANCGFSTNDAMATLAGTESADPPRASAAARAAHPLVSAPRTAQGGWPNEDGGLGQVAFTVESMAVKTGASGTAYAVVTTTEGVEVKAWSDTYPAMREGGSYRCTVRASLYRGVLGYSVKRIDETVAEPDPPFEREPLPEPN